MSFALKFRERLDSGTADELDKFIKFMKQFLLLEHNEDGSHIVASPTTNVAAADVAYVTVGNTSSLTAERALVGTAGEIEITDGGANGNVAVGLVASPTVTGLTATSVTVSGLTSGRVPVAGTAGLLGDDADLTFATDTLTATKIATTSLQSSGDIRIGGAAGAATTHRTITKKVTGIADNSATDVLTITIPNANHAGALRLLMLSSNGGADAFESNRAAQGLVVFQRNTGFVAIATAAAIADGVIATNADAGSATHTLAYAVSAVSGAAGDPNTFTITVTIDDSGTLGSNQVVILAELLNSEATGLTIT